MLVLVSVVYYTECNTVYQSNSVPKPGQNFGNFKNGEKIVIEPIFTMLIL
jgi:hypothetical protein